MSFVKIHVYRLYSDRCIVWIVSNIFLSDERSIEILLKNRYIPVLYQLLLKGTWEQRQEVFVLSIMMRRRHWYALWICACHGPFNTLNISFIHSSFVDVWIYSHPPTICPWIMLSNYCSMSVSMVLLYVLSNSCYF